jgi:hypothetical protein
VYAVPSIPIASGSWSWPGSGSGGFNLGWDTYVYQETGEPLPIAPCEQWQQENPRPANCGVKPVVTTNGCGAGGGISSWFIPNLVFSASCTFHDVCYGQLNSTKESCDAAFIENSNNACDFQYAAQPIIWGSCNAYQYALGHCEPIDWGHEASPVYLAICKSAAAGYHSAVQTQGLPAFTAAHQTASCLQWHLAKEQFTNCPN